MFANVFICVLRFIIARQFSSYSLSQEYLYFSSFIIIINGQKAKSKQQEKYHGEKSIDWIVLSSHRKVAYYILVEIDFVFFPLHFVFVVVWHSKKQNISTNKQTFIRPINYHFISISNLITIETLTLNRTFVVHAILHRRLIYTKLTTHHGALCMCVWLETVSNG